MINNFNNFTQFLNFDTMDDFYFVQILKRRKDNPEMSVDMQVIDNFFIYNHVDYIAKRPRIIDVCTRHNARAYIRVNRRSLEKTALMTLKKVTDLLISKDYKAVKSAYLSACGENHSEPIRRWVIDIDKVLPPHKFDFYIEYVESVITMLHLKANNIGSKYKILGRIETVNGIHLITHPFNLQEFNGYFRTGVLGINQEAYPLPDIHKDNPTLLYKP